MADNHLTPFPKTAPMVRAAGQTARGIALAAAVGLVSLGCDDAPMPPPPMPADAGFTSDSGPGPMPPPMPADAGFTSDSGPGLADAGPPDAGAEPTDAGTDADAPDADVPDAGFDSGVIAPMPPPPMPAS